MVPQRSTCAALLLAVMVLFAGCSPAAEKTTAPPPQPPPPARTEALGGGLPPFYSTIPDPDGVAPGTILASEPIALATLPNRAFRVAYSSRSVDDHPIAVTGLVILPNGTAPPGGWPILSWAHSTTGIGDRCAPSTDPSRMLPAQPILAAGYAFVATDYEGLGTIGRHPYLVGASEARSTLDIALAASRVPDWSMSRHVAVWGHSQGGHAALFTTTIAERYAPEILVEAIVAGAPASGLDSFAMDATVTTEPFPIMVGLGFNGIDPERLPLDAALSDAGVELAVRSTQACNADLYAAIGAMAPNTALAKTPPSEEWRSMLRANDPLFIDTPSSVPTLILHGDADDLIPAQNSVEVLRRFCALGRPTELWLGLGTDHTTVVRATLPSMVRWISARLGAGPDDQIVPDPGVHRSTC